MKAASEFYKNRLMLDGLYSHCKTCYQASAAARSAARNPVDAKACRRCGTVHCPQLSRLRTYAEVRTVVEYRAARRWGLFAMCRQLQLSQSVWNLYMSDRESRHSSSLVIIW